MNAVSVIIPTRDRPALLESALESLKRNKRPGDEVVVVDSASRDPAVSRIGAAAGVKVVRLERPGTSRARNAGMAAASGSLLAYIDDDCLIQPFWTERIERVFDESRLGFVTGRVTGDRDTKVPVSVVVGDEPLAFERAGDPSRLGGGVNMAFRRIALEGIGGFDEGMGPATRLRAAEDHDVIWRLLRAGWAGRYEPSILVTHQQWRTTGRAVRREYAYGIGAGALAMKMIRVRDPRGWRTLRERLWADGVAMSGRHLAHGYESGAAGAALKALGVVVGALRASRTPMVDDRFGV
jgi:glycosyltransferase involved in cell wall biosynthesis